jgi:hypothetical protein
VSDEESLPTPQAVEGQPVADGVGPIAVGTEDEADDRLFGLVTFGLMILLLICIVLVLIADRRPPAGL